MEKANLHIVEISFVVVVKRQKASHLFRASLTFQTFFGESFLRLRYWPHLFRSYVKSYFFYVFTFL
jgi:hypothetical protein